MGALNFMVSDEIANEIDTQQFQEESQEVSSEIADVIVIQFESTEGAFVIPGLLQKYKFQEILEFQEKERFVFQFITDPINTINVRENFSNVERVFLTKGGKNVTSHCLRGMRVTELTIEQSPANAGCMITIVYK